MGTPSIFNNIFDKREEKRNENLDKVKRLAGCDEIHFT